MSDKKKETNCPICNKNFPFNDIEQHANRCIFLNCPDEDEQHKRKRSPSPNLNQQSNQKTSFGQKSPRIAYTVASKSTHHENSVINSSQNQPSPSASSKILEKPPDMSFVVPLAKKVQPKTFEEFLGQPKVLGKSTVLRSLLEKGEIPNMILWGPPGCGKTSLSGILREICSKNPTKLKFSTVCAAVCGVKEVQNLITISKNELKFGRKTVLFMDEIHAFNKKQQDTMLLSVEKGEIILVGATTENPSFSINSALLSRCRVVVMEKLDCDILLSILKRAALTYKIKIVDDITTASEDSNADPKALQLAVTTMEGCQLLGMPEADVLLAQCVIYLARAPKSREVDKALGRAKALILNHKGIQPAVPMHIRNAPTTLMKKLGYGKLQDGGDFVFMPPELKDVNFFD
nr:ATPase WRNIP1-like [Leptinotarsa decemlineata]